MNLAESTNPRHRRAFADARLAVASRTGSLEDLRAAEKAVQSVGNTTKARNANFPKRLAAAALKDEPTQTIVEAAKRTLDPKETPREKLTWVGTVDDPHDLVHARRYSEPFSLVGSKGASMGRSEVIDPTSGDIVSLTPLSATDLEGDRVPHYIPIDGQSEVDVVAVRTLPDDARVALAGIVSKIG